MLSRLSLLAVSAVFLFGPPSIKVNKVANPATAAVKGAVFLITAHHHQETTHGVGLTGRAEGIVAGKRVSRPLTLVEEDGVYGVKPQWAAGQPWVLVFTVIGGAHGDDDVAEAVVKIAADGKVKGIEYPMKKFANGNPWPRRAEAREIDEALKALSTP